MWKRENIIEELEQISGLLAGIPRICVYTTPASYFQQFPANIMQLLRAEHELPGLLPSKANEQVYSVPGNYFEAFPDKILSVIKAGEKNGAWEELNEISPLLASIPKYNVYQVPKGYFEKLSVSATHVKTKVLSFKKAIRYAVAATIISVMAVGGYLFFNNNSQTTKGMATVQINVPAAVHTLSEYEIERYLEDHSTAFEANSSAFFIPDAGFDVQQVIKDLSTSELQQFLKENPAPVQGS